jgi:hypothetical protein
MPGEKSFLREPVFAALDDYREVGETREPAAGRNAWRPTASEQEHEMVPSNLVKL